MVEIPPWYSLIRIEDQKYVQPHKFDYYSVRRILSMLKFHIRFTFENLLFHFVGKV